MTYAELENRLARYLGLGALADDPDVAAWAPDALNDAQEELAYMFRIPRYEEAVAFNFNPALLTLTTAQYGGILSVVDADGSKPMAITDRTRLYSELPNFAIATVNNVAQYVVQDEANPNSFYLYPVPITVPRNLYVYYAAVPGTIAAPTDEPWDGQYQPYHELIALRAALMLIEADWADKERAAWIKQRFDEKLGLLAQAAAPGAQLHRHNVTEA